MGRWIGGVFGTLTFWQGLEVLHKFIWQSNVSGLGVFSALDADALP